jgi:hypothetical protein
LPPKRRPEEEKEKVQLEETREKRQVLKVYTIVEKPGQDKGIWLDIGVAVVNRDGSISAKLDALPLNGQLHLREPEPRNSENNRRNNENSPQSWRQKGSLK